MSQRNDEGALRSLGRGRLNLAEAPAPPSRRERVRREAVRRREEVLAAQAEEDATRQERLLEVMRDEMGLTPLQLVALARNLLVTVCASIPHRTRKTPEEDAVTLIGLPGLYVGQPIATVRAELRKWFRTRQNGQENHGGLG